MSQNGNNGNLGGTFNNTSPFTLRLMALMPKGSKSERSSQIMTNALIIAYLTGQASETELISVQSPHCVDADFRQSSRKIGIFGWPPLNGRTD